MPNHRTPTDKAEVNGRAAHDPARFKDRSRPKGTRPLGEPYKRMTEEQQACWHELAYECPWLHSAHRPVVRLACTFLAKMDEPDGIGISAANTLSALLSKLGATPSDESKVNHGSGESDDPDDEFFTTH